MILETPTISVIIPVYNAVDTVREAIDSVQRCINANGELIVIDGGSTDGTLAVLKQLKPADNVRWISEPDKGIYDAMNKGIKWASGQWIYFLGADDQLAHTGLVDLIKQASINCKLIFGNVQFDNGHIMRSYVGLRTYFQNTVHHQSALYHRSLFESFRYDTSLKLLADYELNLRIYCQAEQTFYVDELIAFCHSGGASSNLSASLRETNIVRGRFIKSAWKQKALSSMLTLYYGQKKLRRMLYGHKV